MGLPNPSREETRFSGANGDRETSFFSVHLAMNRIGNLTRLVHTLLCLMPVNTYIDTSNDITPRDQNACNWIAYREELVVACIFLRQLISIEMTFISFFRTYIYLLKYRTSTESLFIGTAYTSSCHTTSFRAR